MKNTILIAMTMLVATLFGALPDEVKNASKTETLIEIINHPGRFLDFADEMSFTNKVIYIGIVDKAVGSYPMPPKEKDKLVKTLEKYYYISTNTPYLNVPLVVTPQQTMNAMMSELQYTINGTNVLYRQKSDRTNTVYKVNSNYLDFNRPQDADIVLIFEDNVRVPATWKGLEHHRGKKERPFEPAPYYGQSY